MTGFMCERGHSHGENVELRLVLAPKWQPTDGAAGMVSVIHITMRFLMGVVTGTDKQ